MTSPDVRLPLLLAAGLLLSVAGCGGRSIGYRSILAPRGVVCEICTWDNRPVLVLLSENTSRRSTKTGFNPVYQGQFQTADGRNIAWNCTTNDGKTGNVVLDGATHDLAKGNVFLILTQGGGMRVQQLTSDVTRFGTVTDAPTLLDCLKEMAKAEPAVVPFTKAANGK